MARDEFMRSMVRALADVKEEGTTYLFSDSWDVTVYGGRQGTGFTIPHVVKLTLEPGFVVMETAKGHRHVVVDEDVRAFAQEPSQVKREGRKTGFV